MTTDRALGGATITDTPVPEDRLSIERAETDEGVELRLAGDIDPHTAELFRRAVEGAATERGSLAVDMSGVTFVDSSGLRVLADAQRMLESDDRVLVVRNASSGMLKLLEVTGLADFIRTEP